MTSTEATTPASILLPLGSLTLLAAGSAGREVLLEIGWQNVPQRAELDDLLRRLESSEAPDAPLRTELSRRIASVVHDAAGHLTISSLTAPSVPTYALVAAGATLVVRLHGPVVEWLLVDAAELRRLVALAADGSPDLSIVASCGGEARAGVHLGGGRLRTAARRPADLDQLRISSLGDGLGALVELVLAATAPTSEER